MSVQEAAIIGVIVTILIQIVGAAFMFGGLFSRVRNLENVHSGHQEVTDAIATLRAEFGGMSGQLGDIRAQIGELRVAMIKGRSTRSSNA